MLLTHNARLKYPLLIRSRFNDLISRGLQPGNFGQPQRIIRDGIELIKNSALAF